MMQNRTVPMQNKLGERNKTYGIRPKSKTEIRQSKIHFSGTRPKNLGLILTFWKKTY